MLRSGKSICLEAESKMSRYMIDKFRQLEEYCEYGVAYRIDPNRPDYADFLEMLKKRVDVYNDVYIYGEWEFFERIFTLEFEKEERIDYWTRRMNQYRHENPLQVTVALSSGKRKGRAV